MATKKLTVEVDLETTKTKRKLKELERTGGSSASGTGVGGAADGAARSIKNLGSAASETHYNMRRATRAFTGLALGLAGQYAAQHMQEGSRERKAVEYGSSALGGAAMGAMVGGPIGAIVGGLGGVLKTYLDHQNIVKTATADYQRGEHDYQSNKDWRVFMRDLTDVGDSFSKLKEHIEQAKQKLDELKEAEATAQRNMEAFTSQGATEKAAIQKGYLDQNRAMQEQLENFIYQGEKKKGNDYVMRGLAPDALTKIGGAFTDFRNDGIRTLGQTSKEQLEVLKRIEAARRGGAKF